MAVDTGSRSSSRLVDGHLLIRAGSRYAPNIFLGPFLSLFGVFIWRSPGGDGNVSVWGSFSC